MSTKTARITLDVPKEAHKPLKRAALLMDVTIKDLLLMSFEDFMLRKPNKVTLKAMRQAESGKGTKKLIKLEDLFEDLGI